MPEPTSREHYTMYAGSIAKVVEGNYGEHLVTVSM